MMEPQIKLVNRKISIRKLNPEMCIIRNKIFIKYFLKYMIPESGYFKGKKFKSILIIFTINTKTKMTEG